MGWTIQKQLNISKEMLEKINKLLNIELCNSEIRIA